MLFFEVLDNFPHDKLIWNAEAQLYNQYTTVCIDNNS